MVPTWNYELVHVHGTVRVHDDPEWVRTLVSDLTDRHESDRSGPPEPWQVTDAPASYIDGQLRAIVGVEVEISSIEAKRKLSQNRPEGDRAGVEVALTASDRAGDHDVAAAMRRLRELKSTDANRSEPARIPCRHQGYVRRTRREPVSWQQH